MQIVINIPEKTALEVLKTKDADWVEYILRAVANGIPLPKGHGRLIDADALEYTLGSSDRDIYVKCCLDEDAPTIIEADKETDE